MMRKHLRVLMALLATLVLCASLVAKTNKQAEKLFKQAQLAEVKQQWDEALTLYQKATDLDPTNQSYQLGMRRTRFQAGQKHVNVGQKLRNDGKYPEAIQEFQKAIVADPSSAIALQELKRTQAMIDKPGPAAEKGLTPAETLRRQEDQKVASMLAPPEIRPVLGQVPPLKMNNQPPRILYETVGKLAGINVVFDSTYQAPTRGFNVDLTACSVEQAFDYLAVLTHTYWKPISANTIFVTEDSVTKRRDYEDEVVKVFYVTNATSTQEFQEIATAIRTVAEIRRVFTYNAQKAMVVRGTADQVALAEKLVRDLDKPKSEVVVDVLVLETNTSVTKSFAATIATGGTAGLNVPISFTPLSTIASAATTATTGTTGTTAATTTTTTTPTTSTSSSVGLNSLGHLSSADFSTSLPGALIQAMLSDSRTKVLNSPQLRASDGMKAELQIGDRIPYATGSFQPGVGTVGVSPLVSTQFQFVDTGVTVIMTPQVHSAQEVTMHLEITVSQVSQYINLGGLQQPVISQRKSTTDIRLRDGEVNLLGGLNQITNSNTLNGIPGLVDIPVLGKYLFGNPSSTKADEQLMIALVPHIVRTPDYTPENLRGIFAGSDQVVKLSYAPRVVEPVAAPAPAPAVPANPAPPAASVKPPAPAAPAAAVPVVATPGAAVTAASAAAPVAPAPATATPAAAAQAVAAPAAPAPVVATSTPAAAPPVVVPPAVAAPAKASPRAASPAVAVPAAPPAANPVPVPPPATAASVTPPTAPAGGPASADAPAHASGLAEIAARLREPSPRFPAFEVPASGLPFGLPSAIPAPSATPSEAASAVPSGAPSTAPSAAPAAAPATASATPSFSPRVRFTPETVMASNGTPFTLNVMLDNAPDASAALAPLRIHWDSAKLHLNDISPGELFSRDGVALHIEKEIHGNSSQAAGGEATLTVTRAPGSAGISGSGAVATLNFVATSPGTSAVAVLEAGLKTTQSQAIPAATGDVVVTVH